MRQKVESMTLKKINCDKKSQNYDIKSRKYDLKIHSSDKKIEIMTSIIFRFFKFHILRI